MNPKCGIWCAVIFMGSLVVSPAPAHVVRVPQDAGSIQAGVNAADHGDTVLIQCGTYDEYGITLKSGVAVLSETGDPGCVEVNANSQGRAFSAVGVEDVVLQGLRITGGVQDGMRVSDSRVILQDVEFADNLVRGGLSCFRSEVVLRNVVLTGNYSYEWGAGLFSSGSSVTLEGCVFRENEAGYEAGSHSEGHGGAIHAREGSTLDVTNTVFEGNRAWIGGGAVYLQESDALFDGCEFADNEGGLASDYYNATGGGIAAIGGSLTVLSSVLVSNTSGWYGGGAELKWGCDFSLTDVVFVANAATWDAGGLLAWECAGTSALNGCTFDGNDAKHGGGCYIGDMTCSLSDCIFVGNTAELGASGAQLNAGVDVAGCTFHGNASPGGCIETKWSVAVTIANTILSETLVGRPVLCSEGASVSTYRSCVYGNAGGDSLCGDQYDILLANPLFCSPQSGDLSLCSDSPCAAENTPWGELVGALGVGCPPCDSPAHALSWGRIKAIYR